MATQETHIKQVRNTDSRDNVVGPSPLAIVRNVIYVLFAVLESLLFVRFLLSLFGANRANTFADFIYTITGPFVAPFRGLFSINTSIGLGTARFEYEVVVAMIVYALLAMVLLMALRIPDHSEPGDL